MKITIDTANISRPFRKAGNFIATKTVALRDKMHDIRVTHDAKQLLRNTQHQLEVQIRALQLQGADELIDAMTAPKPRGTSRNKAAVQPRKRTPR